MAEYLVAEGLISFHTPGLAMLYYNQVKQEEARTLLADIYSEFNEGFDTTDLREAKEMLNHLCGSASFAK